MRHSPRDRQVARRALTDYRQILSLQIAVVAGILGTMARGFEWI
jgi:hypothetical protein